MHNILPYPDLLYPQNHTTKKSEYYEPHGGGCELLNAGHMTNCRCQKPPFFSGRVFCLKGRVTFYGTLRNTNGTWRRDRHDREWFVGGITRRPQKDPFVLCRLTTFSCHIQWGLMPHAVYEKVHKRVNDRVVQCAVGGVIWPITSYFP